MLFDVVENILPSVQDQKLTENLFFYFQGKICENHDYVSAQIPNFGMTSNGILSPHSPMFLSRLYQYFDYSHLRINKKLIDVCGGILRFYKTVNQNLKTGKFNQAPKWQTHSHRDQLKINKMYMTSTLLGKL